MILGSHVDETEANMQENNRSQMKIITVNSGAPEARSFVTSLFAAAPSVPQAPKVPEDRLPADGGQW